MIIQRTLILFSIFFFSIATLADPPKAYLDMEPGFFSSGMKLYVDGKELNAEFWRLNGFSLSEAMKDNPQAFEYARKHETYGRWASISLWSGLGGAITYLAVRGYEDYEPGIYWGIFATGFITGLVLQQKSLAYLFKSINAYNLVGAQTAANLNFKFGVVPDGGAVALTYSF